MPKATYSIITVTRNRPEHLRKCLERTRKVLPEEVPIIVYDDASSDAEAVRSAVTAVQGVQIIRGNTQIGPGGGRNRCLEAAKTPFCLSLDDDCFFETLPNLERWMEQRRDDRDIAVVGFRYFNIDEGMYAPEDVEEGVRKSFHGGASLLRRETVLSVGGYLDWLGFAAEDTELANRLAMLGYRTWYDPSVIVHHDRVTLERDLRKESYNYVRNTYLINVMEKGAFLGVPLGLARALRRGFWATPCRRETFGALLGALRLTLFCLRERRRLLDPRLRFISSVAMDAGLAETPDL